MKSLLVALFLSAVISGSALAGAVTFTTPPKAVKPNGKVKITFAVSARTDVEVAILNAAGKVVRHLAAGVLGGEKAPPKPLGKGLSQNIEWDGRDDRDKPASGGPFTVRVRAGTQAGLGRFLGHDPYLWTGVDGLATDEKGTLYVIAQVLNGQCCVSQVIRSYTPAGEYVKTVFPPPADLPAERLKGLPQATGPALDKGFLYPQNYQPLMPWFFPRAGQVVFLGNRVARGRMILLAGGCVERINSDGTVPEKMVLGRFHAGWGEREKVQRYVGRDLVGGWQGAVFPGGDAVLIAGKHSKGKLADFWKAGRIHRVSLTEPLIPVNAWGKPGLGTFEMKPYADVPDCPQASKKDALAGVDVDSKGNAYVCDRSRGAVMGFDAAGKLMGKVKVEHPYKVAAHEKTGALYVMTLRPAKIRNRYYVDIVKLSAVKEGRELARHTFKGTVGVGYSQKGPFFALDRSSAKPTLWVANVGRAGALAKLVDNGASFAQVLDLRSRASEDSAPMWYCWVNPVSDEVFAPDGWGGSKPGNGPAPRGGYIRQYMARFDGKTGKRLPCKFSALDMAFDLDGNVYYSGFQSYKTPIWRLTPDLKPLPFPGSADNKVTGKDIYGKYGWAHCQKGLAVGRDGTIYACTMRTWSNYFVVKWGPDGKFAGEVLPYVGNVRAGCVKVDAGNNIYLGVPGRPKGNELGYKSGGDWFASSVVKTRPGNKDFAPRKGGAKPKASTDWAGRYSYKWLGGLLNAYPHQAPNGMAKRHVSCTCKEARYDLDHYGRLYIPNVLTYRITVVDNAGNVIKRIGHYGNADSMGEGPKSPVKKPAIPLGYPMTVGAAPDHNHIYVGDSINNRIVRIDTSYDAEATCAVGGTAVITPRTGPSHTSDNSDTSDRPTLSEKFEVSEKSDAKKLVNKSLVRAPKQVCTGWFSAANNYKKVGMIADARRCLNNIIKAYPDTEWAARARRELKSL
jgi:sugar lactone lactonase YvrE